MEDFSIAIDNYAIVNGRDIHTYKNDKYRVISKCKPPWW